MSIRRIFVLAAALSLGLSLAAAGRAQNPGSPQTQIQLQYHEAVAADADSTPVFRKIIDRISNDCELVGKAFGKKCVITQLNIYSNQNFSGEMVQSKMVNATATIMLRPEGAGGSTPSSPPVTK